VLLPSPSVNAVDVIVVSYNSRDRLRDCVEPLAALEDVNVIVADNASSDGTLDVVADLAVTTFALGANGGFAHGCNAGWRAGEAPYVLFLNPDARLDEASLRQLVRVLADSESVGVVAPRILGEDGAVEPSQRRFPRVSSTYAHALFLHRLFPRAAWASELVRDPEAYDQPGSPEWVSGACLLVRRSVLERIGGWDEGFFLYCEDKDLCRRVRDAGFDVRYEPRATVTHAGGSSAPRSSLLPVLAASRVRYARKHRGLVGAAVERVGIALIELTHMLVSKGGRASRAGHAAALRVAAGRAAAPGGRP
jgi:N-acetylglucosaminyl-diphospho-decaprenol L-rhamnosyltransferase